MFNSGAAFNGANQFYGVSFDNVCIQEGFGDRPVVAAFPYKESFEAGNGGWTPVTVEGSANSWELGSPSVPTSELDDDEVVTVGAPDGVRAWATGLSSLHANDESSSVVSPFFNFSNLVEPVLKLDVAYETEFGFDGLTIQASTDGGASWSTVSGPYNGTVDLGGTTIPGFTGNVANSNGSDGFVTVEFALTSLAGEESVLLRAFFNSNETTALYGVAFDNVCIDDVFEPVVEIAELRLIDATDTFENGQPPVEEVIKVLEDGDTIEREDLAQLLLTVEAVTSPETIGSVVFELQGTTSFLNGFTRVESFRFYTLFGENGNRDFLGEEFRPGDYTLTVTPFEDRNATGAQGTPVTVNFTLVAPDVEPFEVVDILLYDTDRQIVLDTLQEGDIVEVADLANTNLGLVAFTDPSPVGSVDLTLTGPTFPTGFNRTEGFAPYSIFGDQGLRDINGQLLSAGSYNITAIPFNQKLAEGLQGPTKSINFQLVEPAQVDVTEIVLVDAITDTEIKSIVDGDVLNLDLVNGRFNIVAKTNPGIVGSVELVQSGPESRTQVENVAPYSLWGDQNGDFIPETYGPGQYTVTATPFTMASKGGDQGIALTVTFTLNNVIPPSVGLNVFPNTQSVGEAVNLSIDGQVEQGAQFFIYDTHGFEVKRGSLDSKGAKVSFDNPGTYVLRLVIGDRVVIRKVLIQ